MQLPNPIILSNTRGQFEAKLFRLLGAEGRMCAFRTDAIGLCYASEHVEVIL
jgi:hypothetical protein